MSVSSQSIIFADTIIGGDGNDTLTGTKANDSISGGGGNDSLSGGRGYDWIDGGDGNDTLGAEGSATLIGGAGNDSLVSRGKDQYLDGGAGDDRLFSTQVFDSGHSVMMGGEGNDRFWIDLQYASEQTSWNIDGGAGDDLFYITASSDPSVIASFIGGGGGDRYQLQADSASMTGGPGFRIEDFHAGSGPEADCLDLSALMRKIFSSSTYQGGNPFSADLGYFRLVQVGADTQLQFDADGLAGQTNGYRLIVTLANVKASDLSQDNFTPYLLPDGAAGPGQLLTGGDDADLLSGSVLADTLNGGGGDDTLSGSYGGDLLHGGDGNDLLSDYSGTNTIFGGAGNDTLQGSGEVYGDDGDDDIVVQGGTALADGGAGNDHFNVPDYLQFPYQSQVTLRGGAGDDSFNLASPMYSAITVEGGDGNDLFKYTQTSYYSGRVKVTGGAGVDTFEFGVVNNTTSLEVSDFQAGKGGDLIDMASRLTYAASIGSYHGGNPFAASGVLRLVQQDGDTLLQYNEGSASSFGFITILTLKNVVASTLTADNFIGGYSPDGSPLLGIHLNGTDGDDTLTGSNNDDTLSSGAGADSLDGNPGNDLLEGGDGNDTLNGGSGDDTLDGGNGNDSLIGGNGNDSLLGGLGNDSFTIWGGGNTTLDGGSGNDFIFWSSGSGKLEGGDGDDIFQLKLDSLDRLSLEGGAGNDLIIVDRGTSFGLTVTGGAGIDTYKLNDRAHLSNPLIITDFTAGAGGDRLDILTLLDYADGSGYRANNPFDASQPLFRLVQSGADTLLQWTEVSDGVVNLTRYQTLVTLKNITASALTTANFIGGIAPNGSRVPGAYITGSGADDALTDTRYDDTLSGGAGNDTLIGYRGSDTLDGGDGIDDLKLYYREGNIKASGGAGNDRFFLDGSNFGYTSSRNATLDGGAGDDYFNLDLGYTGQFSTTVTGGVGSDEYRLSDPFQSATMDHFTLTDFATGQGGDVINVRDVLNGLGRESAYVGGNPFFSGGLRLVQQGNDTLLQTHTGGDMSLSWTTLLLLKNVRASSLTADNFSNHIDPNGSPVKGILITESSSWRWQGGQFDDTLIGSVSGTLLDGAGGNDLIQVSGTVDLIMLLGGAGNDTLLGGGGDDVFYSGTDNDSVDGGNGDDSLRLPFAYKDYVVKRINATDTELKDSTGNTTLIRNIETINFLDTSISLAQLRESPATAQNDYLSGDVGDNTLNGLAGADTMEGGAGNDTYVVDNWNDVVNEKAGEGVDLMQLGLTSTGTYTLGANVENATVTAAASIAVNLNGNALDNVLIGNVAANTLTGGAGHDTLDGGAGADKLIGGSGNDTYIVDNAGDVVTELTNEGIDGVRTSLASYTLSANVENLTYTGSGAFTGAGNALDNFIIGGNGGNKLDGGTGNDEIRGGSGNDSILGGAGDDTVSAGAGKDTIDGGEGMDTLLLAGGFASYTIKRVNNTDTTLTDASGNVATVRGIESISFQGEVRSMTDLWGNAPTALNDSLSGSTGDDTLDGGAGADTLAGGTGNDTYIIDNVGDVVVELANAGIDLVKVALTSTGTYVMGDNVENASVTAAASVAANVTGNALYNLIIGNAAGNTLAGGAGNDTLDGGTGADKLLGGTGDDLYIVDNAADVVTEAVGEGTDTVQTTLATYTLGANVENLTYTGAAAFTGTGNALGNVIIGGNAGNKLDGGAGNDTLSGGSGNDCLQGGLGDDAIVAGTGGKDAIDGGAGADVLQGLGNFAGYTVTRPNVTDTVLTSAGGNVLTVRNVESFVFADGVRTLAQVQDNIASIGNDNLHGTAGNDTLNGGLGVDTLAGGLGDDTYVILNAADLVVEDVGDGTDLVQVALTAPGTYTLAANVENATVTAAASIAANITGNALDNILTGNAAANALIGGAGNDTLIGGSGADKLSGGVGDDTYVVADAGDVITELAGEGTDLVQTVLATYTLAANMDNLTYAGAAAFTGTGNALGNVIIGGNAGNKLDGGAGNDTLSGGNGNDSMQGGLGDDVIVASAGKDTIDGGAGADVLQGLGNFAGYTITRPNATDTVLASAGGNVLTVRNAESFVFADGVRTLAQVQDNIASVGNDNLHGTDGDDILNGGLGVDTLDGGLGNDTYVILNTADVVLEGVGGGTDLVQVALAAAGTYVLAANVENATVTAAASIAANITGNGLDNVLTGNAAANTLIGGAGNDTLNGAAGADKLIGGIGDDLYTIDNAGDVVTEAQNEGSDSVRTSLAAYTLTANVETLVYTGTAAFTAAGNALDNVVTGGDTGNKIDGGAGNDSITGGNGADSLVGGLGNDTMAAGSGKDTIDGGDGIDVAQMVGNFADYTVTRPNATDTVLTGRNGIVLTVRNVESFVFADGTKSLDDVRYNIVSVGNDKLYGGDGNDTLNGGAGADTMTGGLGKDSYVIDNAGDKIVENLDEGIDLAQVALTTSNATYALADNVENATVIAATSIAVNLTGNDLDNFLTGNAAANKLIGGAGNDTLDGGAGNDALNGGIGDDLYVVGESGDTVTENADEGTDTVRTSLTKYTLAANVENMEYTGSAAFTGTGNALNNSISGGAGANTLIGGAGNDTLSGHGGNDSLSGGDNDDRLDAGNGKDTIDGGAGSDTLTVSRNFADYTITRPNATDTVLDDKHGNIVTIRNTEYVVFADGAKTMDEVQDNLASAGNDYLRGTANADVLDGGAGIDTMEGGLGNDGYVLSSSDDVVIEAANAGMDSVGLVFTKAATYIMSPNVENAIVMAADSVAVNITGNELANWLTGNGAANILIGGDGNDTLQGLGGADTLIGGAGNDIYVIDGAASKAVVVENGGDGIDQVTTNLSSYRLPDNVENLFGRSQTGPLNFTGTGNALNNVLNASYSTSAKLDGGAGNDTLVGSGGNDSLLGGDGDDHFEASSGKDTVDGGSGFDTLVLGYPLGNASSFKVKQISASDIQLTDASGYSVTVRGVENFVFSDITATLENLTQNLHGVGTSADVIAYGKNIVGTSGADNLVGSTGNDSMDGAGGSDTLTGGSGADTFLIPAQGMTTITDMVSGSDRIMFHSRDIKNAMFLNSQVVSEPGTTLYGNVVIFTQKLASFSTFAAANLINSNKGYYDAGEQMICVLSTATDTALYRFTSSSVDNVVSASELTQIAILTGTPSTTTADYHFIS